MVVSIALDSKVHPDVNMLAIIQTTKVKTNYIVLSPK